MIITDDIGKIITLLVIVVLISSPFIMLWWSAKYGYKGHNPNPNPNRICPFCGQRETVNCCNTC